MDEATWYLDSDDSSPLGSPSTPPTLNGEWPCWPQETFRCALSAGTVGRRPKPAGSAKPAQNPVLNGRPTAELDGAQPRSPESTEGSSLAQGSHYAFSRL